MLLAMPEIGSAQSGDTYRIETKEGSVFIGILISESDEAIVMLTESIGEVTIRRDSIRTMTLVDADRLRSGNYWYDNPNGTRYLFAPNAIGLKKGTGYYQNTWVFFNNVNYGISDHFSFGVGIVPLFLFSTATPVWITPKVSYPVIANKFHISAGALLGGVIGSGDSGVGGVFYGGATYGTTDANVTVNLGYGYTDRSISSSPVLNISAMQRIARRGYIITENYILPGSDENGIASIGFRYAVENATVDFALLRPLGSYNGFIGIPWLGITIPFGG